MALCSVGPCSASARRDMQRRHAGAGRVDVVVRDERAVAEPVPDPACAAVCPRDAFAVVYLTNQPIGACAGSLMILGCDRPPR